MPTIATSTPKSASTSPAFTPQESPLCRAGDVLRGAIKPAQCAAFGKECTPRHPLGATMVSSEGACAAYYNYGRFLSAEDLASAGSTLSGAAHG